MRSIGGGCGQLKERRELRGCLELRDRVEVLERARERVGQAPHCSRSKFFDLRVEVLIVNTPGQMLRGIEFALYEGLVDDQFCCRVRKTRPLPRLDLFPHRLEVPLHAIHTNGEDVHEAQVFGVFGEHGREHARVNVTMLPTWYRPDLSALDRGPGDVQYAGDWRQRWITPRRVSKERHMNSR